MWAVFTFNGRDGRIPLVSGFALHSRNRPTVHFSPIDPSGTTFQRRFGPDYHNFPGKFLARGEVRRELIEISMPQGEPITPGRFAVKFEPEAGNGFAPFAPAVVEMKPLSATEATAVDAFLRMPAPHDKGHNLWPDMFQRNQRKDLSPVTSALQPAAARRFALFAFLHHVVHGPDDLAHIDLKLLDAITEPLFAPEVLAMRYELLNARGDKRAPYYRALLEKTRGMKHRIDDIDAGSGWLSRLR
jgi:hypothetical protein